MPHSYWDAIGSGKTNAYFPARNLMSRTADRITPRPTTWRRCDSPWRRRTTVTP